MVALKRLVKRLARAAGIEIRRAAPQNGAPPETATGERLAAPVPPGSRIDVGAGEVTRDGYLRCDLRPLPGVALVCPAWRVSAHCRGLAEIYSRHMLEHLTWDEANRTLADWHRALAVGGTVHIVVPDLRAHIEQWNRAEWSEASLLSKKTDARWGFAGFYGWQRHCDPLAPDYDPSYWDVHKSGYDSRLMEFLLARHGFGEIEIRTDEGVHLVARARRIFAEGERQVAPTLDGIRADHIARYRFAAERIEPGWRCLDAACGIGYGARLLADAAEGVTVLGVDREPHAIGYGRRHYGGGGVALEVGDVLLAPWETNAFDAAVTFETIEHLDDPARFLAGLAAALRPGGLLVASTPNETLLPFDPERFPHHVRHWRRSEFDALLERAGFRVEERWCQVDKTSPEVLRGDEGNTLLAVARRT